MAIKNNVTRLLESRGIAYTPCELPKEKLGAVEVAEYLGVEPDLVYKTIVVTRPGGGKHILAVVPGPNEVDLKALAKTLGEKKVSVASQREAEKLTKLQVGGISPLALLQRGFEAVLDVSVQDHAEIYISGGQRGLNILLPTEALIRLTNAKLGQISHP